MAENQHVLRKLLNTAQHKWQAIDSSGFEHFCMHARAFLGRHEMRDVFDLLNQVLVYTFMILKYCITLV